MVIFWCCTRRGTLGLAWTCLDFGGLRLGTRGKYDVVGASGDMCADEFGGVCNGFN